MISATQLDKYQRWYWQIIERAHGRKLDEYRERHHVIPRALGGSDDIENLIDLTYREHFLVHWLLAKTTLGEGRNAMVAALHCMTFQREGRERIIASWQFEVAKRALKDEAIANKAVRKQIVRQKRKIRRAAAQTEIHRVAEIAANMNMRQHRDELTHMAASWIKGDPRRGNLARKGLVGLKLPVELVELPRSKFHKRHPSKGARSKDAERIRRLHDRPLV